MSEYGQKAIEKLDKEYKSGTYDRYAAVMKDYVRNALKQFAAQDEEFAQAIVQGGKFEDCMKAVAHGCGNALSDLDAYGKAAEFYFPGAKVRFLMKIDLVGECGMRNEECGIEETDCHANAAALARNDRTEEAKDGDGAIIINLSDFL